MAKLVSLFFVPSVIADIYGSKLRTHKIKNVERERREREKIKRERDCRKSCTPLRSSTQQCLC